MPPTETTQSIRPLAEVGRALSLLRRTGTSVAIYGIAAGALIAVLVTPLVAWAFFQLLSLSGAGAVLNFDLTSFFLSFRGFLMVVLWALSVSLLAVLVLGGPTLLTAATRVGHPVPARKAGRRVLAAWTRVPGVGAAKYALLAAILAPAIAAVIAALTALVLAPFGAEPPEAILPAGAGGIPIFAAAFVVLLLVGFWLHVRWFLSMHVFLLEDASFSEGMKESARLVRRAKRPVTLSVLAWYVLQALVLGGVALLLGFLDHLVLGWLGLEPGPGTALVIALMLALNTVVLALLAILGTAGLSALATNLYARLSDGAEERMAAVAERMAGARPGGGLLAGHPGRIAAAAVLLFAAAAALTVPEVLDEMNTFNAPPLVTAHRGSSAEAPENTLAAIRLAIEDQADVTEFDVFQAGDGTLVVTHDPNLKRIAGVDLNVWQATAEQLAGLEAGSHFDEKFRGEPFPTLDQVIETVQGKMHLNIELKTHGHENGFAEAVVETIHRHAFAKDCVITSLDPDILKKVRAVDPDLKLGMIITAMIGRESSLDVDFYSVEQKTATVDFIKRSHQDGREVHVWTVNDRAAMEKFIARGADSLITDYPRLAREILDARSADDEMGDALQRLFRP